MRENAVTLAALIDKRLGALRSTEPDAAQMTNAVPFELANTLGIRGYPHVTLYVGGARTSGVYFGKGDFLQH